MNVFLTDLLQGCRIWTFLISASSPGSTFLSPWFQQNYRWLAAARHTLNTTRDWRTCCERNHHSLDNLLALKCFCPTRIRQGRYAELLPSSIGRVCCHQTTDSLLSRWQFSLPKPFSLLSETRQTNIFWFMCQLNPHLSAPLTLRLKNWLSPLQSEQKVKEILLELVSRRLINAQ